MQWETAADPGRFIFLKIFYYNAIKSWLEFDSTSTVNIVGKTEFLPLRMANGQIIDSGVVVHSSDQIRLKA